MDQFVSLLAEFWWYNSKQCICFRRYHCDACWPQLLVRPSNQAKLTATMRFNYLPVFGLKNVTGFGWWHIWHQLDNSSAFSSHRATMKMILVSWLHLESSWHVSQLMSWPRPTVLSASNSVWTDMSMNGTRSSELSATSMQSCSKSMFYDLDMSRCVVLNVECLQTNCRQPVISGPPHDNATDQDFVWFKQHMLKAELQPFLRITTIFRSLSFSPADCVKTSQCLGGESSVRAVAHRSDMLAHLSPVVLGNETRAVFMISFRIKKMILAGHHQIQRFYVVDYKPWTLYI